jgi:hypothetical protein
MFGSRIGAIADRGDRSMDRSHVHDGAAVSARLEHGGYLVAHAIQHAVQVNVDYAIPVLEVHLTRRGLRSTDARVVHRVMQRRTEMARLFEIYRNGCVDGLQRGTGCQRDPRAIPPSLHQTELPLVRLIVPVQPFVVHYPSLIPVRNGCHRQPELSSGWRDGGSIG